MKIRFTEHLLAFDRELPVLQAAINPIME